MTDLKEALNVIAAVHPKDNEETGYAVSTKGIPMRRIYDRGFTLKQYIQAWGLVCRELGLTHEQTLPN